MIPFSSSVSSAQVIGTAALGSMSFKAYVRPKHRRQGSQLYKVITPAIISS